VCIGTGAGVPEKFGSSVKLWWVGCVTEYGVELSIPEKFSIEILCTIFSHIAHSLN